MCMKSSILFSDRLRSPVKSATSSLKWTTEEKEKFEEGLVNITSAII